MSLIHPRSPGFLASAPVWPHDPSDERAWTSGPSYQTASGVTVDYATALRVSCIFQGVRLIGNTIGSMPIRVLRDLGDDRKEPLRDHYLRRLLRKRPNSWQTAQSFRATLTAWSILWGYGIAEIKAGARGAFDELWPIEPEWITPERIRGTNRLRFVVSEPGEPTRTLLQDEVFRIDGFGLHAHLGESVLKLAREAIALWISHEKFEALYFGQGAKPSVWLQVPSQTIMSPEAYLRIKENVQKRYGGWHDVHKVGIVEQGITVKETGFTARDSQMREAKRDLVEEMARFLNITPQLLMLIDEPTHSSAEVFNQQVIDYTFMPHAVAWEQSAERDLLFEGQDDDIYIKHVFDSLLRGKTLERAQAYASFIMNGVLSQNECRIMEDRDPWPGLDEPRRSANQDIGKDPGAEDEPPPRRQKGRPKDEAAAPRQFVLVAEANASRVVRRELAALRDQGAKHASDPEGWAAWLEKFYADHQGVVAEALQLPPLLSRRYVESHREALKAGGLAAAERWEKEAVDELTALALAA